MGRKERSKRRVKSKRKKKIKVVPSLNLCIFLEKLVDLLHCKNKRVSQKNARSF